LNDCWAPDPACYLTDQEIGLEDPDAPEPATVEEGSQVPGQ